MSEPLRTIRDAHRPHGRRLGIIVGMPAPDDLLDGIAEILTHSGELPARRLARLRPRPGETTTRPQDVAWFVQRFGHEYTTVVLDPGMLSPAAEAACRDENCTLVVTDFALSQR
ncbi:hypothetical protein [Kineosporia sp. NBRC 101731]|uniref:hypothetical protein n=1 Tax=Kineosporia sp. NBRC 101731 TaxID=3032199 RepID=UPI0024A2388E|nr:hypothetical protein [Kineosporia sp. NBRC 101731]GLY31029.1 hypothetical protein Kisp02_43940 [Kineosporia sp. NBRC 101731]